MADDGTNARLAWLEGTVLGLYAEMQALSAQTAEAEEQDDLRYGRPLESGGGDGGGAWQIGEDDEGRRVFKNCFFMVGRRVVELEDQPCAGSGKWCLTIDHEDPESSTVAAGNAPEEQADDKTVVPLVEFDEDGEIVKDWRGMPCVAVWE